MVLVSGVERGMKEIVADVGREGEVILPAEVRAHLGLEPRGRITIIITDEGTVHLRAAASVIVEAARGETGAPEPPLTWERIEEIAREDREDRLAHKLGITPRS